MFGVVAGGRDLLRPRQLQLLGQRDDDALGAADVAEPMATNTDKRPG